MKKLISATLISFAFLGGLVFFAPVQAKAVVCDGVTNSSAECYQPLAPIKDPNGGDVNTSSFPTYLQAIYRIGIGACFVLGVIMFTWAGIEYIISESMNSKSDAKKRITNALTGLAIALVSYILLNTINPDLLKLQDIKTDVNVETSDAPGILPSSMQTNTT